MICSEIYGSWMEAEQEKKIEEILRRVSVEQPALDVGSGPGFLERHINGISTDIDIKNLKKCRGVKLLASGDALPFKDGSFRTVFCIDALHLIKNAYEILRVLRSGGIAIVTLFCSQYNRDERMSELKKKLERFEIQQEFFVQGNEWEAVVVARKRAQPLGAVPQNSHSFLR